VLGPLGGLDPACGQLLPVLPLATLRLGGLACFRFWINLDDRAAGREPQAARSRLHVALRGKAPVLGAPPPLDIGCGRDAQLTERNLIAASRVA
jgi:hypothetical protein